MAPIKILVIDDEQIILDSVKKILGGGNYSVDVTLSSRQGLDWAIQRPYDVVLTDVRMPEIGGMRVLRDVKRAKPSLPVVIITGFATVSSAVQAMKLGATDYLEKPFTPEDLLNAIASALDVAATRPAEDQGLIHKAEMLMVLERAISDPEFALNVAQFRQDALTGFELTGPEKLALLTGDINWIQNHIGALTPAQKQWLEGQIGGEVW